MQKALKLTKLMFCQIEEAEDLIGAIVVWNAVLVMKASLL